MTTEADKTFAEAALRLKLAEDSAVRECMKTVVDGTSPDLAEAMIEKGVLDRVAADRVRREARPQPEPPPADSDEEHSPAIDGYEIVRKLGEGGMGCVWLARQTSLDRLVAIKVLPSALSLNKKLVERFRREALATAKLNHPNIVSAIDVGRQKRKHEPDLYYFVIEYVDGQSVDEIIRSGGKIAPMRATQIAIEVTGGLDHAWTEAGIVHRDIKPANILITRANEVKLADLGLARSAYESANLTTVGLAIGTPHYASPEQALGKAEIDTRSDIYGLGATLFHMLTDRVPFEGESGPAVMARHVNEDAPPCTDLDPLIPKGLSAIVTKMMERDPTGRYQTPGELRADLERFAAGDRPLAYTRLLDATERDRNPFASGMPEVFNEKKVAEKQARIERERPRHWPHAIAATLFVAAMACGLWLLIEHTPPAGAPTPPAAGIAGDGVALSFDISSPGHDNVTIGASGSFPASFSAASGVRCYVTPKSPSHIYVVLITSGGPADAVALRLLSPDETSSMSVRAETLTILPKDGGAYSLPPSARLVGFLAIASEDAVARADVVAALVKVSDGLSSGAAGLQAGIRRGQTLWYNDSGKAWLTASGESASGEAAATLSTVCEKVRAAFDGSAVSIGGAATACAVNQ